MLTILLLFVFVIKSRSEYSLVFSDEFNQLDSIDQNKWDISHEEHYCDGSFINQLNCKTNSTNNIRLTNGALALTAIREKYLNKDYTSPMITTKEGFTYGKFEIRAALPKGKMLRTAIYLIPTIIFRKDNDAWSTNGQIDMLVNQQDQLLINGLHWAQNSNKEHKYVVRKTAVPNENLNDFHVYGLEWSNMWISWSFDGRLLANISLAQNFDNNIFDKPFKVRISLGVGGIDEFFPGQTLTLEDSKNWSRPSLILDFIRIYQRTNTINTLKAIPQEKTSPVICNSVMKDTKYSNSEASLYRNSSANNILAITVILGFLFVMIIF